MPVDLALKNKKYILAIVTVAAVLLCVKYLYFDRMNLFSEPSGPSADETEQRRRQDQKTMEETADLVKAKDPAKCDDVDKIVNGINYKTVCLNNIYYNMSADNLDFSACEKLVDMSVEDCQRRVMLLSISKEQNLAVCDKVPDILKLSCPDAYWNYMATFRKDPSLCAKTASNEMNSNCQNGVLFSMVSRDAHIECSSFSDPLAKSDCENYLKGKDSCALIKSSILRGSCVQNK
jgi:hypothetical protein